MSDTITIILPGEPRGKGRPRFRSVTTKSGRSFVNAYTPERTRSYEALLRDAAQQAMGDRPLLQGALAVYVLAHFSVPKSWSKKKRAMALIDGTVYPTGRPDADNIIKTIDSISGIVWRDDAQIVSFFVGKRYGLRPALEIAVTPLDASDSLKAEAA